MEGKVHLKYLNIHFLSQSKTIFTIFNWMLFCWSLSFSTSFSQCGLPVKGLFSMGCHAKWEKYKLQIEWNAKYMC